MVEMYAAVVPDTVLFDMDGTLLDSRGALLGAFHDATLEVLGERYPVTREDADRIIQLSSKQVFSELAQGDRDKARDIEQAFHRSYGRRADDLLVYDGVPEMLATLRGDGLTLGIVTSKSRVRLERDLRHNGIASAFVVTVCGDEVEMPKPDPGPVRQAIERLGANPASVLFVGDGVNDVRAGQAAGVSVVGAGYGFHPIALRAAEPDHWIDSPLDLVTIVRSLTIP